MAKKCPVCEKRKGKRRCHLYPTICSACCGSIRGPRCPEECPYFKKGQAFEIEKEINKAQKKISADVEYFEKNNDKLIPLVVEIEKSLYEIVSRDPHYDDKTPRFLCLLRSLVVLFCLWGNFPCFIASNSV